MAKPMRKLGFYTQYLAKENNVSDAEMCEIIGCNNNELHRFYCGRLFLHFDSIKAVAARLNISVKDLLEGGEELYNNNLTHNVGEFTNIENREKILDLIDDYVDLIEFS